MPEVDLIYQRDEKVIHIYCIISLIFAKIY